MTDKELPLDNIIEDFDEKFDTEFSEAATDQDKIKIIERILLSKITDATFDKYDLVEAIISYSIDNPLKTSSSIAKHFGISERTLHQIFHDKVGVGIKWITARNRLQKAMHIALESKLSPNWTIVSQDLGYADQSHFINDFKKIIGMTPGKYFKQLQYSRQSAYALIDPK